MRIFTPNNRKTDNDDETMVCFFLDIRWVPW